MTPKDSAYDAKSKPYKITFGGKNAIIWGDPNSISEVFGSINLNATEAPKVISVSIAARRCKRYPSDPGYTIPETTVKRLNKVNPKRNAALPGRTFTACIEVDNNFEYPPTAHIYNFRIQGAWATLDQWFRGNVSTETILWSPSGHPTNYAVLALTQDQPAEVGIFG
jgi:hypothetical protein